MMQYPFVGLDQLLSTSQMHYTIFVPLTQKDDTPQPAERLAWVEEQLVKRAGGLTLYYPSKGLWIPPTARPLCQDSILPVHLVMAPTAGAEAGLVELVAEITRRFEQDETFVLAQPVWRIMADYPMFHHP